MMDQLLFNVPLKESAAGKIMRLMWALFSKYPLGYSTSNNRQVIRCFYLRLWAMTSMWRHWMDLKEDGRSALFAECIYAIWHKFKTVSFR